MIPEIYPLYTWTTWEVTKGNIAPMPRGLRQRNDTGGAAIQFIVGMLSPFSWLPPDADEHRGFQRCALIQSLNQVAIGDHHVHNHHHCSFKKPWVHVWVWILRFGTHHCPVVAICGHAFLNGNLGPPHWLVDGIIWWPYTQKTLLLQQQPRDCTAKSWPASKLDPKDTCGGCRRGRSGANSSEIPWQTGAPSLQRSCGAQTLGVRNLIASKCGSKKQSNLILLRVFHALHCFIHKFLIFKLSPRNYPPGFGEKLVKIFQELITLKQGMPTLPDPVPDAKDFFLLCLTTTTGKTPMSSV